jgi:dihydroorotase
MDLLIKNGRLIDAANNLDNIADIYINEGHIAAIGPETPRSAGQVIDAEGCWVTPGFIDLHTHLRDPGFEYKETILTGSQAAVKGGFTAICCMPNTHPVIDTVQTVEYILQKAAEAGFARVFPIGAITKGQRGEELSPMAELREAGVCAFSEDGKSVANTRLMCKAFETATALGVPIFDHCEDAALAAGGVINAGESAERLHLPGIPGDAEDIATARELLLAQSTGARLHLCHVSTARSAWMLEQAQTHGVKATGEVCPHHFSLCDEDITSDDGQYKMNPPLRSRADMQAMRKALASGVIGVVATDHAPHAASEKSGGFKTAPFGITGLETAFGLCVTELINTQILTPAQLVSKLTANPARILGLHWNGLSVGAEADITVTDPAGQWTVEPAAFYSKGRNTPFNGKKLTGMIKYTLIHGRIVYGNR